MKRDRNLRKLVRNTALRLIPLLLVAGLVHCGGKNRESSPSPPASPAVAGPAASPDMAAAPAPDMAPSPAVPEKEPELVGGWLDAKGQELVRLPGYKTFPFVTPELASACKLDALGLLTDCVAVDRAGRIGKKLDGRLKAVLRDAENQPFFVVEMDRGPGRRPALGLMDAKFDPLLVPRYASIRCVASCEAFLTLEIDDSAAMYKRNEHYSASVNEYTYRLHNRAGFEVKTLAGPIVIGAELDPDFLNWIMTPAGRSRVVPYRKGKRWGLVNPTGKVVLEAAHEVLRTLPSGAVLVGGECNEERLLSNYIGCGRWEVLDTKGQTMVGPFTGASLPYGRDVRNVALYTADTCTLFREDGTPVKFKGCDGLMDLETAGRVAFLHKETGRWGLADHTGKTLVEPVWHHVGRRGLDRGTKQIPVYAEPEAGLLPVMTRDASGLEQEGAVDLDGKVVIELKWERVWPADDVVHVRAGGKWGVLDRTGRELLSPRYAEVNYDSREGGLVHFPKKEEAHCHVTPAGGEVLCGSKYLTLLSRHHLLRSKNRVITLHATATGKQVGPEPLPEEVMDPDLFVDGPAGLVAWASKSGDRVLFALVGRDGPLTPFRYTQLGEPTLPYVKKEKTVSGLTPFFIDNRK